MSGRTEGRALNKGYKTEVSVLCGGRGRRQHREGEKGDREPKGG